MSGDKDTPIPIFTIGYGQRDIVALLDVLHSHNVQFLTDIRSQPYSQYNPDYNQKALAHRVEAAGIRYVFIGDLLGGRPDDPACYREGKVDYEKVAQQDFYLKGIGRLVEAFRQQQRVALMCSEGKPEQCHRATLIGRTLTDLSIPVAHIDEDGRLITQEEVILRVIKGQPSLFGDDFFQFTSRKKYQADDEDD